MAKSKFFLGQNGKMSEFVSSSLQKSFIFKALKWYKGDKNALKSD